MTSPDTRAAYLINSLGMQPHPEGGFYREVYRSAARVTPDDSRAGRAALTTIYFLLPAGEVSRWHRVNGSDEVWHFYEGAPLELLTADDAFSHVETRLLGPVSTDAHPVSVVPGSVWQAARSTGDYSLVGCTVGPGFDFADFEMLRDRPADAVRAQRQPAAAAFL